MKLRTPADSSYAAHCYHREFGTSRTRTIMLLEMIALREAVPGPGCVKKASYWHRAQNTAGIRALRRDFSWNPFSERPGTLPGASAGIDLNAQHPSAQVARASSSPATPMIAITRLML